MKQVIRCLLGVLIIFLVASEGVFAQSITAIMDQAYGKDPLQKMDIYLVPNRTKETPLVVLIHGGGWMAGDKKDADFMKDFLLNQGINVVNINYRLASHNPPVHYKEIMQDVDGAINYIASKANEWKIRKDKIVFWGGSAGGHISLLYAYRYDTKNRISAVISLGGPTKLYDEESWKKMKKEDLEGLLPLITGISSTQAAVSKEYENASPYYASKFKPSYLIHGEADKIVAVEQTLVLGRLLDKEGVPNKVVVLPNGGHGGEGTTEEASKNMVAGMLDWIATYSK